MDDYITDMKVLATFQKYVIFNADNMDAKVLYSFFRNEKALPYSYRKELFNWLELIA